MTSYCDGVHLADDAGLGELHGAAKRNGLKRENFRDDPGYPHYVIPSQAILARVLVDHHIYLVSKRDLLQLTCKGGGKRG